MKMQHRCDPVFRCLLGLAITERVPATLLLNFEMMATMAIAWLAFRDNVDR